MNRIIIPILCLLLVLSLVGCGNKKAEEEILALEQQVSSLEDQLTSAQQREKAAEQAVAKLEAERDTPSVDEDEEADKDSTAEDKSEQERLQQALAAKEAEIQQLQKTIETLKKQAQPATEQGSQNSSNADDAKKDATSGSLTMQAAGASFPVSADDIHMTITNGTSEETSFGFAYTIEKQTDNGWEKLPLDFPVQANAQILPAGDSTTLTIALYQGQYDYTPGTYRLTLSDSTPQLTATFQLA